MPLSYNMFSVNLKMLMSNCIFIVHDAVHTCTLQQPAELLFNAMLALLWSSGHHKLYQPLTRHCSHYHGTAALDAACLCSCIWIPAIRIQKRQHDTIGPSKSALHRVLPPRPGDPWGFCVILLHHESCFLIA